ncbi:hypothetical protein BO94DRAFT_524095 [Aspergillus sclerotioniger CBS 115572]|uniref:MARVEL domain-containing protein n=1 Tax=Aspergillus sclerotioniger CBS 115572 TaxID=1450535 RepID=A0A317VPP8_9EURO|nr:hypothetical protein BO94DRAFT_524095 [Aspergillus sclerotioniger CBS 115572]PWY75241.1 hypothetical protein BO94DRAFT_524095 [Aspergillus sclerotioniger CBS 115572]
MNPLIIAILRGFQFIFSIIVLGISISLAKGQRIGSVPASTGYAAFTGGLGTLASLIGIAGVFIESLQTLITWAVDGLAGVAFVAGGITYAILLRGTSCSNILTIWDNTIISGGCRKVDKEKVCWSTPGEAKSRCTSAQADAAFMFLGFVVCVGVCGMGVLRRRKGGVGFV